MSLDKTLEEIKKVQKMLRYMKEVKIETGPNYKLISPFARPIRK